MRKQNHVSKENFYTAKLGDTHPLNLKVLSWKLLTLMALLSVYMLYRHKHHLIPKMVQSGQSVPGGSPHIKNVVKNSTPIRCNVKRQIGAVFFCRRKSFIGVSSISS